MSNPNCTITFTAKNSLVAGVTLDDEIQLHVTMIAWDRMTSTNKVTNEMKSGRTSSSKFYTKVEYSVSVNDMGIVTLQDTTTTDLTSAYMDMFFRSVDNDEEFTITDIDNADLGIDVKLVGDPRRQRKTSAWVNKFDYSFTVREVI